MKVPCLNQYQQQRLLSRSEHIGRLLYQIAELLEEAEAGRLRAGYRLDLTPWELEAARAGLERVRASLEELKRLSGWEGVLEEASLRSTIRGLLGYLRVAIQELNPRYLRNYGPVTPEIEDIISRVVKELAAQVEIVDGLLSTAQSDRGGESQSRMDFKNTKS